MNRNVRRAYTSEFKEQAGALMSAGRPVGELAQELGVSSNLLYNWRHHARCVANWTACVWRTTF